MRRVLFSAAAVIAVSLASTPETARAQQSYTYSYTPARTGALYVNWRPEEKNLQRYTVSVSPLRLVSNGLKFDFERELRRPGHWIGTSITAYIAQPRTSQYSSWDSEINNRRSFNSGWDRYHRMWGLGTSLFFKNTFHSSGWYYSAGLVLEFYRVGIMENTYLPYEENGLTFYDYGTATETKSYFKPTAQFNIGKHLAISERCYFDLYAGLGLSWAFHEKDGRHEFNESTSGLYADSSPNSNYNPGNSRYRHLFTSVGGFGYRGLVPTGGIRFGVLLWRRQPAAN